MLRLALRALHRTILFASVFAALLVAGPIAGAFEVTRTKNDLVLSAATCTEADSLVKDIAAWQQQTDASSKCETRKLESAKSCSYAIQKCVPKQVELYGARKTSQNGPNCWNTALVMKGILPALRYSDQYEMTFYMSSPLCRQLADNEPRKPGDVGAIRTAHLMNPDETHGFIFVSDKMVYSKGGPKKKEPFSLESVDSVMKSFGVSADKQCRANQFDLEKCETGLDVFRCQSMDEFLKTSKIDEELKAQYAKFNAFECHLQNQLMSGAPITAGAYKDLLSVGQALVKYAETHEELSDGLDTSPEHAKDAFMLGALKLRLKSIGEQFQILGSTKLVSPLAELAGKLDLSLDEGSNSTEK